jgi:acyl-homoserine lactone acylase PvdQ
MQAHLFKIWRDQNGIPHVEANDVAQMYRGQGYVHACDRGMQLLLMRILGQGRACELLDASDEMLAVDRFFRRMNWTGRTQAPLKALAPNHLCWLEAYCDGINAGLQRKTPWEFHLMGYRPEPWSPDDTILMARMTGYLTLAQSQTEVERLLVEMVQAGVPMEKLKELFPGNLDGLDVDLLNKVKLGERIVPPEVLWSIPAPRMMASNNWVVSGSKTASGQPILANDPHLEVNRLPNVWCELVLTNRGRSLMGGTMPGFPGILVGRSPDLAWGATYAFIDASDSWIERCRKGCCYREKDHAWHPFRTRREIIKRKKMPSVEITFYENFDRILLASQSTWFGGESREAIYRRALERALADPPQEWGQDRQITLAHILFGGKLPAFTGFDRGPITGVGSRATVHQSQIYTSGGRVTTFMPSFRWVTDMAETVLHSNLAGGPSDRRFSQWYVADLANWQAGRYKTISPETEQKKQTFP